MKIAFIQCPVWGTYDPPLALAQLSACLKKEENEVYVFDLNIKLYLNRKENYKNIWAWEQSLFWYDLKQVNEFFKDNSEDIESHLRDVLNTGARIVGFSVNAASRLSSLEIAKRLKQRNKEIVVVFGGPLFFEKNFVDSVLLNEDLVDIVIPGEGEITFCELVRTIDDNQDIFSCKGIAFKKDGRTINTSSRELLTNLDELPFLDFTDLPLTDYDDSEHIPFMTSRGCIQRCVFCSSRAFWPGYRAMSGERIFKEIEFHKRQQGKSNVNLGHIDFSDLLFNGNMKSLVDFCDLMRKTNLIYWAANMIIRPEMTQKVIKKMKDAGCEHIIFGIESGSQRILDKMAKHYRIEDADRIVRWLHEEGIIVTANFMFGFPGETKEDFEETLDFVKRNAKFLDRVYPSRTYCALEEYSYLHSHLEEFGIKPNPPNHLYWEILDGKNTYSLRLERCEEFCRLASSLGIEVACGVQTSVEMDKWYNLSFYYEYIKDYQNAIDCFLKYNKLDSTNGIVSRKINFYYRELKSGNSEINIKESLPIDLEEAITNMRKKKT